MMPVQARPFLDKLIRFDRMYSPSKELSLDEAMIRFKGVFPLSIHAQKTYKVGMKAFVVADSKTGYVLRWRLYTGK